MTIPPRDPGDGLAAMLHAAKMVVTEWDAQSPRVFESMGDENPRANAVDEKIMGLAEAVRLHATDHPRLVDLSTPFDRANAEFVEMLAAAERKGAEAERAAVVAWLRANEKRHRETFSSRSLTTAHHEEYIRLAIEAGDHLAPPPASAETPKETP